MGTRLDFAAMKGILWGTQTSLAEAGTESTLWFLPVLFVAKVVSELTIYLMWRVRKKESKAFLLAAALVFAIVAWELGRDGQNRIMMGADIGLMGAALILIGYIIVPLIEWIRNKKQFVRLGIWIVVAAFAIALAYLNVSYHYDDLGNLVYGTTRRYFVTWVAHGQYGRDPILFLISSVCSCVMIINLSILLENAPILPYLGQHTLGLFALHSKLYPLAVIIMRTVLGNVPTDFLILFVLASIVVILCMPIIWVCGIFVPQLEGKSKGRNDILCMQKRKFP